MPDIMDLLFNTNRKRLENESLDLANQARRFELDRILPLQEQTERFQRERIQPLDLTIKELQLQQERQQQRLTNFNMKRQAGLEAQYPWLPLVNAMQPTAVSGIATLAATQRELDAQQKFLDQKNAERQTLMDQLTAMRNEAAAMKADVGGLVDAVLGQFEEDNPGLTFSTRERSSLADFAAQQVDTGALPLEALPGALSGFLANHPRVLGRLQAPEVGPGAPAVPTVLQTLGVRLDMGVAAQEQEQQAQGQAAATRRQGLLADINAYSERVDPRRLTTILSGLGVAEPAQVLSMDDASLEGLRTALYRARQPTPAEISGFMSGVRR